MYKVSKIFMFLMIGLHLTGRTQEKTYKVSPILPNYSWLERQMLFTRLIPHSRCGLTQNQATGRPRLHFEIPLRAPGVDSLNKIIYNRYLPKYKLLMNFVKADSILDFEGADFCFSPEKTAGLCDCVLILHYNEASGRVKKQVSRLEKAGMYVRIFSPAAEFDLDSSEFTLRFTIRTFAPERTDESVFTERAIAHAQFIYVYLMEDNPDINALKFTFLNGSGGDNIQTRSYTFYRGDPIFSGIKPVLSELKRIEQPNDYL